MDCLYWMTKWNALFAVNRALFRDKWISFTEGHVACPFCERQLQTGCPFWDANNVLCPFWWTNNMSFSRDKLSAREMVSGTHMWFTYQEILSKMFLKKWRSFKTELFRDKRFPVIDEHTTILVVILLWNHIERLFFLLLFFCKIIIDKFS